MRDLTTLPRATGLVAKNGLEVLTFTTPNGQKPTILLEELKAVYNVEYTTQYIDLRQGIHKEPWFIKLDPNGKIPVLVDHDNEGFVVPESSATLLYLTRRYDTEYKFHFADLKQQMQVESWISFQSHELAPSFTQAAHWYRQNPNRYPFPTQRAIGEVERIFGVLDTSLEGRDYLVGEGRGNYSIADIASFPFVNHAGFCGVDAALQRWPNLEAWRKRIVARQPVKNGMCTPAETNWDNETVLSKFSQNEDFVAYEAPLQKALKDAQAEFKYKYKSP